MKSIIVYATRYGCSAEVAKLIQQGLESDCTLVNIMTEKVPQLDSFDTVILGGSIYIGKVQKELTSFVNANLKQLLSKKVGLFLCAGTPKQDDRDKELQGAFPPELLAHAVAKDILGYAFTFEKMRFFDRLIMKKIKGDSVSTSEYFDKRILLFVKALSEN